MSETDIEARLDAVERALTDDETDLTDVREAAALAATVEELDARVADLEATVDELEAGLQAVRGYAGNVRAVNREVERRASAALAKAETIESSLDELATGDERTARRPVSGDETRDGPDRGEFERRGEHESNGREYSGWNGRERGEHDRNGREPDSRRDGGAARAVAADGRSHRDGGRDGGDSDGSDAGDGDDGTEQFIQRVREAL